MAKKKDVTKFVLSEPLEYGSEVFTEFDIRKPVTKDIRGVKFNDNGTIPLDNLLDIGADLIGQTQSVVDRLSMDDGMALAGVVHDFLTSSQKTGKK